MILTLEEKAIFVKKFSSNFFNVDSEVTSDDVNERKGYLVKLYIQNKADKNLREDSISYAAIISLLRSILKKNFNVSLETTITLNPNKKNGLTKKLTKYKVIAIDGNAKDKELKLCEYCNKHLDNTSNGVKIICDYLTRINKDHVHEFTYEDCKDKSLLPFDIWLKICSKDVVIEFDGQQHFSYPNIFHKTPEEYNSQVDRDKIKNNYCIKNKIHMIRIAYDQEKNIPNILQTALNKIKNKEYTEIMKYNPSNYDSIRKVDTGNSSNCIIL